MGQKINPISIRLNVNRQQNSLWFSKNNYTKNLHKQLLLKTYVSQVFQVSNLLLGPCYIQILPKKLKIYPFFNNSTKSNSLDKKSYLFKRYVQSKYSVNRTTFFNRCLSRSQKTQYASLISRQWKKDLFLWQSSKPFVKMLSALTEIKKNKKDGIDDIHKPNYLVEHDKSKEFENQVLNDLDIFKNELKKDLFRFSQLSKRNKKSIHELLENKTLSSKSDLGLFLDRQSQKESSKRLIQWIFYTLFFQLKKNGALLNSKQNCSLFFQFVLMKNVQYILTHNFSKIISQRKSYLSTKHLSSLESQIEKNLLCHSSILPVKVDNEYKSAQLLANYLTTELAKNRSHKQVLKRVFQKAKKFSFLKGIRIACSGRLGGVELAKTEVKKMGQTSLNIFAEKIDYASTKVSTKFGIIGVKIWICFI
jgi:ribosomal protein S3